MFPLPSATTWLKKDRATTNSRCWNMESAKKNAASLASGGGEEAAFWDPDTGRKLLSITDFKDEVSDISWSSSGEWVVICAGNERHDSPGPRFKFPGKDRLARVYKVVRDAADTPAGSADSPRRPPVAEPVRPDLTEPTEPPYLTEPTEPPEPTTEASRPGAIVWETNIDAARKKAKDKGRDLVIVFYGKRCENCARLRADAAAGKLADIRDKFVWVHLLIGENRNLADFLGIMGTAVPRTVLADPVALRHFAPLTGYPKGEKRADDFVRSIGKRYYLRGTQAIRQGQPELAYRDLYFVSKFGGNYAAGKAKEAIEKRL